MLISLLEKNEHHTINVLDRNDCDYNRHCIVHGGRDRVANNLQRTSTKYLYTGWVVPVLKLDTSHSLSSFYCGVHASEPFVNSSRWTLTDDLVAMKTSANMPTRPLTKLLLTTSQGLCELFSHQVTKTPPTLPSYNVALSPISSQGTLAYFFGTHSHHF